MPLSGLLNLLASIALYTPQVTAFMISSDNNVVPPIAKMLTEVVRKHTLPTKEPYSQEKEMLVKECLNLIEVLSLTVPVESCQR
jgi:hypothetical protein